MTQREKEILEWIKENPLISQNDLAKKANITRSSVAVHISNLIKKGKIVGKGYVLPKQNRIIVIGGSNIDISAEAYFKIKERDSNPGKIFTSFGGVGRNIADNLSRLEQEVELLTIVGDDFNGNEILKNCRSLGIGVNNSLIIPNSNTSTYISILDENKDMKIAISAMDLYENFTQNFIESKRELIEKSTLCIVDTNLPQETLKYISENFDIPLFLDCVSTTKALKVKDFIGNFHTIKPNKLESEILTNIKITGIESLIESCNFFISKGVKNVYISLGEEGVFFSDGSTFKLLPPYPTEVVNTTGAGDAFMAGIAYGFIENFDILNSCKLGIACSSIAISSEKTISDKLNLNKVNEIKEELK